MTGKMARNHPATLTWALRVLVIMFMLNQFGNSQPQQPQLPFHYTYLFSNLLWGPSYVYRRGDLGPLFNYLTREEGVHRFTMHGLWVHPNPRLDENSLELLLIQKSLETGTVGDILKEIPNNGDDYGLLNKYWPSVLPQNQIEQFWFYEWKTHGREIILLGKPGLETRKDYLIASAKFAEFVDKKFNKTRKIFVKGKPRSIISLSEQYFGMQFHLHRFVQDIEKEFQATVNVQCKYRNNDIPLIESIEFCFDDIRLDQQKKYNFTLRNCQHYDQNLGCPLPNPKRPFFVELPLFRDLYNPR